MSDQQEYAGALERLDRISPDDRLVAIGEGNKSIAVRNLGELFSFAKWAVQSGAAPKGDKPSTVLMKMASGIELGIALTEAMSGLTFINGRRGMMGDLARAQIRRAGVLMPGTDIDWRYEGSGDERTCIVESHRRSWKAPRQTVTTLASWKANKSIAKKMADPSQPWHHSTDRMHYYRTLGYHVRDWYSDVLGGFHVAEELHDIPGGRPDQPELPQQIAARIEGGSSSSPAPAAADPALGASPGATAEEQPVDVEVTSPADEASDEGEKGEAEVTSMHCDEHDVDFPHPEECPLCAEEALREESASEPAGEAIDSGDPQAAEEESAAQEPAGPYDEPENRGEPPARKRKGATKKRQESLL